MEIDHSLILHRKQQKYSQEVELRPLLRVLGSIPIDSVRKEILKADSSLKQYCYSTMHRNKT